MELKRVVVTGIGALTPIGNTAPEFWNSLINGVSGASPITRFDASLFKTKFACEVKNLNVEDFIDRKEMRRMDRYSHLGIISAAEAIEDSKFLDSNFDNDRCGVIWGSWNWWN
jgi:3-oxoacyl-[acyl-carrier-protein] synthase II